MNVVKYLLFLGCLICIGTISATQLVTSSVSTDVLSFTQTVTSKTYDRATGTFYVGLTSGAGVNAVAKAKRTLDGSTPRFTGIATGTPFENEEIEFLTLATRVGNKNPLLGIVTLNGSAFSQTSVIASTNSGSEAVTSDSLNDANSATTSGIVNIAANNGFIFAGVRPNSGDFGDVDSGIALIGLTQNPLVAQVKDATTGNPGNLAVQLDQNSSVIIDGGAPVTFPAGPNNINVNKVAMHWDGPLKRLYIGLRIQTAEIGKAVVVGRINETTNNSLDLIPIVDTAAIDPTENEMIVADGANIDLRVKKIGVMHASTGTSYLIINGGRGSVATVSPFVFAFPLVDLKDPSNILQGTLANKDEVFGPNQKRFTDPATAMGELPNNTDRFTLVGTVPLPLSPGSTVTDMVVEGDAVYIAINDPQTATNDPGIFYSQAMFGPDGKVLGWTPWTKRAFPFFAFPPEIPEAQVMFLAVDALIGNVWAVSSPATVGGNTSNAIHITAWDTGQGPGTLVTELNNLMPCGSCSVLDLDQSTRGFVQNTDSRYALFGGPQQVVFARVSEALGNELNSSQELISNFTSRANLLNTKLPECSGPVLTLEYSRQLTPDLTNYFFAGTQKGLFVFTDQAGNGFDVSTLAQLNQSPFVQRTWQNIPTISGRVIDIKTTGNTLYILTQQTSCQNPLESQIQRVDFTSNINTMFNSANIIPIANTGVGSLSSTLLFSGMQVVATAPDGSTEQLVLATNNGVFRTSRLGGVQDAINQIDAGWVPVTPEDPALFNGIAGMDNASTYVLTSTSISPPSTVWPYSIRDQEFCCTFDGGSIHQVNGSEDIGPFNFCPIFFNSIESDNPTFFTLDKIISFFTEGGRRFFVVTQNNCCCFNNLFSLPFNTLEWCATNLSLSLLSTPVLNSVNYFTWIRLIGVTGILMAGTNSGVVALE